MAFDISKVLGFAGEHTWDLMNNRSWLTDSKTGEAEWVPMCLTDSEHDIPSSSYRVIDVDGADLYVEANNDADIRLVGMDILIHHTACKEASPSEQVLNDLGKWEVRRVVAIDGYKFTLDQAPDVDLENFFVQAVTILELENLKLGVYGDYSESTNLRPSSSCYGVSVLAVRIRDTLQLDGGRISAWNQSLSTQEHNGYYRPLTPQEQNGILDSDPQAGEENLITKDRLLMNLEQGIIFIIAKNIVVTDTSSRIGNSNTSGVQYCRAAADSETKPPVSNSRLMSATNIGGSTIFIACETFEGFAPDLIAKYNVVYDETKVAAVGLPTSIFADRYVSSYRGLARCYIACQNPPSALIDDGKLYYLDDLIVEEEESRLQGFEIQLAEQQITETVTFTAAAPFRIMQQTTGQFLDYKYNLRIESITQRGILYTCRCCTNLDDILYTQLEYSVPEVSRQDRTWHSVGREDAKKNIYDEPERANATGHVEALATALGISYKNQFDDFVSTADVAGQGGSTYADKIRELFGWSARIPTLLINAFIRDDCLYVIQRGHEEHVIDISNAEITQPIFTRELVRTYWGESVFVETEVRTVSTVVNDFDTEWWADYKDDGTLSEGAAELAAHYNPDALHEPYVYLRKRETINTATGTIDKYYNYDENGLLTETIEISSEGQATTSRTVTTYEYDYSDERNVYLKEETMTIYDKDGAITEQRVITYNPTGTGQASAVGKTSDGETFLNTVKDIPPTELPSPYALNKEFQRLQNAVPEIKQQRQARQQERLVPGIVPFDTSFPIVGDGKLIEITNAIKWLNRRTKETVTVTLYDYEHLIDFNDRVALYGNEYFLVSNTLTTTPHVRDQQNLTLVRWY